MSYIAIAVVVVLLLLIFRPLYKEGFPLEKNEKKPYTIDDDFNTKRKEKQLEIDRILEKIHKKGVESLSKQEKALLDEFSNPK